MLRLVLCEHKALDIMHTDTPSGGCLQVFFCKYNDPVYVKLEKLEIVIRCALPRSSKSTYQPGCFV